jgi:hypothetical protein
MSTQETTCNKGSINFVLNFDKQQMPQLTAKTSPKVKNSKKHSKLEENETTVQQTSKSMPFPQKEAPEVPSRLPIPTCRINK